METSTKKTKAMYFEELRDMVLEAVEDVETRDEMVAFIEAQLESLEKRKAATQARAAKKREESDAMTDAILEHINDELQTVDDIVAAVEGEDVTRNKVTARLGKLVKAGTIVKESVKTEAGKRMAYRLA